VVRDKGQFRLRAGAVGEEQSAATAPDALTAGCGGRPCRSRVCDAGVDRAVFPELTELSDPRCTVRSMAERPTTSWRRGIAEEAEELAAGTLDPDCTCMAGLFPDELLVATDAVLDAFETELPALAEADDAQVFAVVERVVLALNAVNEAHDQCAFETDEREELCDYIDEALTEHGVDVVALTTRHGLGRYQLTDKWRKW